MKRIYDTFRSRVLERTVEYLWFGHSGRPLVMFPTAGGRFNENEDRNLVSTLQDYVDAGKLQVCCIDAFNNETLNCTSVHPAERVRRHGVVDRFWREEMMPMIAARARRHDLALYGASAGAFHAVNFAARHPDMVSRVIAFSGFYNARRVLDGHWDDQCYFHSPMAYIANMGPDWVARLSTVEWIIATGENDSLVEDNRGFISLLRHKNIPVHGEIWPGVFGHDWPFWKEHLRRFLP